MTFGILRYWIGTKFEQNWNTATELDIFQTVDDFFKGVGIGDLLLQGQVIFGNTVNIALENSTNLWKYDIGYTVILNWYEIWHINVFLELWAQLFKEKLGTRRLAIKCEGTQSACTNSHCQSFK